MGAALPDLRVNKRQVKVTEVTVMIYMLKLNIWGFLLVSDAYLEVKYYGSWYLCFGDSKFELLLECLCNVNFPQFKITFENG